MRNPKFTSSSSSGLCQLNLVNSSRLQALRSQPNASEPDQVRKPALEKISHLNHPEDAQNARLQQLLDQRIIEILAKLPTGKQRSLFKIRFGLELDEFKQLPIRRAAEILKINPER